MEPGGTGELDPFLFQTFEQKAFFSVSVAIVDVLPVVLEVLKTG